MRVPVHHLLACLPLALPGALMMGEAVGAEGLPEPIYDESKVPEYTLPDPLTLASGEPVETPATWREKRRPELLALFREHVYGRLPGETPAFRVEPRQSKPDALGGKATRRLVTLHFTQREKGPRLDLLIYVPNEVEEPAATFIGLNFGGNHTVQDDPAIPMPHSWAHAWGDVPAEDGEPSEQARGARRHRWPAERIVERGYALVTAYYGDLFPDRAGGFSESVYQMFADEWGLDPSGGDWSAISAWAWGLHRMLDYARRPGNGLDGERAIVMGHSRLGKTSLWAAATDQRFAGAVSNASGCGGAALSKRRYGERLIHINKRFPHWFCRTFSRYNENESALPVDQHQLIALSAPRPVLINTMKKDRWSDPRGMFLAARHASPVWRLLGAEGLAAKTMPEPGGAVTSRLGFRYRPGGHDVLPQDWSAFMDFADKHLPRP